MSEAKIVSLGIEPMAYIKAFALCGTDPRYAYRSVPIAVKKVLDKAGLELKDIDLIEIHEAFAAQVLANFAELGMSEADFERVNVNGSCISLGHPLGATGARIVTTLAYEMKRRNAKYGMLAICGGGGMGVSIVLER
jgi:acetyl-CoA C-acetyltransferase